MLPDADEALQLQIFFATPHRAVDNVWRKIAQHVISRQPAEHGLVSKLVPASARTFTGGMLNQLMQNYRALTEVTEGFISLLPNRQFDIWSFLEDNKDPKLDDVVGTYALFLRCFEI